MTEYALFVATNVNRKGNAMLAVVYLFVLLGIVLFGEAVAQLIAMVINWRHRNDS